MTTEKKASITKNEAEKKITIVREFEAQPQVVWNCWTETSLLEQWWAPKPWKAVTKKMDFREGGIWLYHMLGPGGEKQWVRVDFETIEPITRFSLQDAFCDENGNVTDSPPGMHWNNQFIPTANGTKVVVEITFKSVDDMKTILSMGFEEGFTAAHGNLDKLLAGKMVL